MSNEPTPESLSEQIVATQKHLEDLRQQFRDTTGAGTLQVAWNLYRYLNNSGDGFDYQFNERPRWDNTPGQNARVSVYAQPLGEDCAPVSLHLYAQPDGGTSIDLTLRLLSEAKVKRVLDALLEIEKTP